MRSRNATVLVMLAVIALVVWATTRSDASGGSYSAVRADVPAVYNEKMGNETVRAELGRSTWTLLHTMAARYPDEPHPEQIRDTSTFITLLSRLYPCGQCAEDFQKILEKNPPELSSKDAFIQWACKVHNFVNARLRKREFDCATVKDRWTCGCVSDV